MNIHEYLAQLHHWIQLNDFDGYNDMETFIITKDNIDGDYNDVLQLAFRMQDEIAEMSYMSNNARYEKNIREIYKKMLKIVVEREKLNQGKE